ncbi:MAG: Rossman fold protein, TIGR00730 family [Deltaproteobacteria bacterium RIFCSPLOWO2_12_FULL_60_19]|nr:MAG: Rossman fold protein, TIGR00730 family [Deltaproteobacteria bacterium RIFCSPLOWO2_12_FULL_60_19]
MARAIKREKAIPDNVARELQDWLLTRQGSPNDDLVVEMLQKILKLSGEERDRGDLKILVRALKELSHAFEIFAPYRSVRKVSMFGSTRVRKGEPYYEMAAEMARRLIQEGFMVITGAGDGIMAAGHEGAGREKSFGVNIELPFRQRANRFIAGDPKLMTFHFFFTRKLIFVKEGDAFVFFPGGFGTHDEAIEALTLAQTGKSQVVPILLVDLPGKGYWRDWESFLKRRLLDTGFISPQDLGLFEIVEDVAAAVAQIKNFYRNYHSYRFVKQDLVIRVQQPPTEALVAKLNDAFQDLLTGGDIRRTEALPEESDDPDTLSYPRLLVPFNRRDFGRLRQMIDMINEQN